jgi:hypothetical protein
MDLPKSQVEIYLELCTQLVRDDPHSQSSQKNVSRDVETMRSRTRTEGLSFLTKTLPKLGKALDLGLISSKLEVPREFKRSHENRNIPALLQGSFSLVFDEDGLLRDDASTSAVKHLRQVLFFVYKLETPYEPEDE